MCTIKYTTEYHRCDILTPEIKSELSSLKSRNERLERLYKATQKIFNDAQFCWEFCNDDLSNELIDAFEAIEQMEEK